MLADYKRFVRHWFDMSLSPQKFIFVLCPMINSYGSRAILDWWHRWRNVYNQQWIMHHKVAYLKRSYVLDMDALARMFPLKRGHGPDETHFMCRPPLSFDEMDPGECGEDVNGAALRMMFPLLEKMARRDTMLPFSWRKIMAMVDASPDEFSKHHPFTRSSYGINLVQKRATLDAAMGPHCHFKPENEPPCVEKVHRILINNRNAKKMRKLLAQRSSMRKSLDNESKDE
jgi:hypothetical protein